MAEELLHTYAADGIALEGVIYPAESEAVLVYTHGVSGSVFRQAHVRVARALQSHGWTVLAGNNRGNGLATPLLQQSGPRLLGGSWFERVEDSVMDISAWIDIAEARGGTAITLLGHSLGAFKAVLYASGPRGQDLSGVVLASGVFDLATRFAQLPERLGEARRAVDRNDAEELIAYGPSNGPTFGRVSARTYLDRASQIVDPWAEPSLFEKITCPVLAFYGRNEPDVGGPRSSTGSRPAWRGRSRARSFPRRTTRTPAARRTWLA